MNYLYTHRGFIVPRQAISLDPKVKWYSAAPLDDLVKQWMDPKEPVLSWEWRRDAILAIKALFDKTPHFFALQLNAGVPVGPRSIDFLYSTLSFIKTGKRSVHILTWNELLGYDPTPVTVSHKVQADFSEAFGELLILPTNKLIAQWLQQPMGLQDLILTAHVIFGSLPTEQTAVS